MSCYCRPYYCAPSYYLRPSYVRRNPTPTFVPQTVAAFVTTPATTVQSGATVPLTTTVYNSAPTVITNTAGVITLNQSGVYRIDYNILATNTGEGEATASFALNLHGTPIPYAASSGTVPAGETQSFSGSAIVNVTTQSNLNLVLTSSGPLNLVSNVIITKIA